MSATIDQRTMRVLIELAENTELSPKDRLDAIGKLLEAKANRPRRTQTQKPKPKNLLGA